MTENMRSKQKVVVEEKDSEIMETSNKLASKTAENEKLFSENQSLKSCNTKLEKELSYSAQKHAKECDEYEKKISDLREQLSNENRELKR